MEFEKLREIIADVMNIDEKEIKEDSSFENDLGADSLDVFQIIMGIEDAFDIEIDNDEAEKIVTVGDAVEQIKSRDYGNTGPKKAELLRIAAVFNADPKVRKFSQFSKV